MKGYGFLCNRESIIITENSIVRRRSLLLPLNFLIYYCFRRALSLWPLRASYLKFVSRENIINYQRSNRRDGRVRKSNRNNFGTGGSSLLPRHFWVYYRFSSHSMEGTRVPFLSSKNCKTSALLELETGNGNRLSLLPRLFWVYYCFSWHSLAGTLSELEKLHFLSTV